MKTAKELLPMIQGWISAGNFMVCGYPAHEHVWKIDDGIVLTNPAIRHRRCETCHLVQERREDVRGRVVEDWTFDLFENIGWIVNQLQALADSEVGQP